MVDCAALVVSKEQKRLMFFKRFTAAGVITAVSNVVPLKPVIQQEGKWCVRARVCMCVLRVILWGVKKEERDERR